MALSEDWAPSECTLPTEERPLRVTEFDDLFRHVRNWTRPDPTSLELLLPSATEAAARDLARRESQCCEFFSFEFEAVADGVVMRIHVPATQTAVVDAIEGRLPAQ
jgi:hypothetical protein